MFPFKTWNRVSRRQGSAGELLGRPDETELRSRWTAPGPNGRTRAMDQIEELRRIRSGERTTGPHALDLRGLDLTGIDLAGMDLTGSRLGYADLTRADLRGTVMFRGDLNHANLFEARLDGAELSGADLEGANLQGAHASGVGLGSANLAHACLVMADLREATFSDAVLDGADLKMASMQGARLRAADLRRAHLARADLRSADLTNAHLHHATLFGADLRGASVSGIRGYESASWIQADVRDVDFNHAHLARRFILDQNYIEEFRKQNRFSHMVYLVWWATSDCGRSLLRWGLLTIAIALLFAGLYTGVELDWGGHHHGISLVYFSVVTLTTLGYGDIVPSSPTAQVLCMVEVFLGYVMLGGLLSIFSNKMARRAE